MTFDFSSYMEALDDNPFEEIPVDLDTFIGPGYLDGDFTLSEIQRELVECMSQIYKLEDVIRIMGNEKGIQHFKEYTKKEVIMQLGKGSGKDFTSGVGCAYLVYKLLCLKNPAKYFGKVTGDAIDIMNVAINAVQARTVFFKGFTTRIKGSPWFQGKYNLKADSIEFDKAITVYSGHSERESAEGLNLMMAILDEISGFNMDNNSGNEKAKTAQAIYDAFRGSVDSRFPDYGKVILLSFPRYRGDFISSHYDKMIKEKKIHPRSYTYVIDPEKAPTEDNTYTIEWEQDEILEYTIPNKILAVKAPSWEVNPGRDIEDYKDSFLVNAPDAYQRFACMPRGIEGGLFKDLDKLRECMISRNPVDANHMIDPAWQPEEDTTYYVHADLAQKQDRAAVAVAHVDKWIKVGNLPNGEDHVEPQIIVDMVAYWETDPNNPLNLGDVADWIINLRRRGIPLGLVTTDRWNSVDFQKQLRYAGVKAETLSVARAEFDDMVLEVYDGRIIIPNIPLLFDELEKLQIINDKKVDHPRGGSKDLADAVAGAVSNAVRNTPRYSIQEVDIVDYNRVRSRFREENRDAPVLSKDEAIKAVPLDIQDWLREIGAL